MGTDDGVSKFDGSVWNNFTTSNSQLINDTVYCMAKDVAGGIWFAIPKTRALGAVVLFPVMTGILLVHIFNAPEGLPMAIILMAINLFIIYENRERYMAMLR